MDFAGHILEVLHVNSYCSPKKNLAAVVVAPDTEVVEIVIGGAVRYAGGVYGHGTIFWHLAGERLIGESVDGGPLYDCVAFIFRVAGRRRFAPEITQWPGDALFSCEEFFLEAERLFQDPGVDRGFLRLYLYCQLFRLASFGREEKKSGTQSVTLSKILRAIRYDDARSNCSVRRLAARCKLSVSGLFALFARELGCTPHQYMMRERIKRAKLLLSSWISVKEVAERCAFRNPETFSRVFRRIEGMSPSEYRRLHLHSSDDLISGELLENGGSGVQPFAGQK